MIKIPPAALEAGARALLHAETPESMDWNYSIPAVRQEYLAKARAAFVAMVAAWEGMHEWSFSDNRGTFPALILPLMENPDD